MNKPLVSVCCLAYNHEGYIRECLDGFMMQKTDFAFEVLIHDDASTDNTAEIIREYEIKYPNIIKPIYQTENQYSKDIKPTFEFNFPRAKGKYIAICEGDDYWTDPLKLQKQVGFMEENEDCSICFHPAKHINGQNSNEFKLHRPTNISCNYKFNIKDAILGGGGFMTTNSMLFRTKYIADIPVWMIGAPAGDYALTLLLATKGHIGFIDEIMSAYRMMVQGSWTNKIQNPKAIKEYKAYIRGTNKMLEGFNNWTNKKYNREVRKKIFEYKTSYLKKIIKNQISCFRDK